jgi:hypothetical protein
VDFPENQSRIAKIRRPSMPAPQKPSHRFRLGPGIVLTILAMIAVPAAITLNRVRDAGSIRITSADPTPQGYTWSLLLFVVPIIVIAGWLFPQERIRLPKSAFWRTISILVPLGFALDFFFAHRFFVFPNRHATLEIGAPALGGPVPIEEYLFYFSGFIAILLIYIWLDEFWLAAYKAPDYVEEAKKNTRLLVFHPTSAVLGVLIVAAAVIYKKVFSPEPVGFPGPTHLKCYMRERFSEMRWGDGESPEVFCGVNGPASGANAGTSTGRNSVDSHRGGVKRSRQLERD